MGEIAAYKSFQRTRQSAPMNSNVQRPGSVVEPKLITYSLPSHCHRKEFT